MSRRLFYRLTALCGILSVIAFIVSFTINAGPPPGATLAQAMAWSRQNSTSVLLGGWLQGIASFLAVTFVLAIVRLANAMRWLSGWLTLLASAIVVVVSMTEIIFYFTALNGGLANNPTILTIGEILITSAQHMYFIEPSLFLPLGIIILISPVLPRMFGYGALMVGIIFAVLGPISLFGGLLFATILGPSLMLLWLLAAAIMLFIRARKISSMEVLSEQGTVLTAASGAL